MSKTSSTSSEDIRASVSSIYSQVLDKRKLQREEALEKKRLEKEAKEKEREEKDKNEDGTKKTKKQKREAELNAWKEIIVGLTGDDLEYSSEKKRKKKYKKWIGDEDIILKPKEKKHKKKNYRKEFEPEINMLKSIVADQNRFTNDLVRRFQNAAGPATKDAMPLNKTLVELAAAINASRSNSLGMLREIGTLKKTIAELYIKQLKESGGDAGYNPTDIALMGSGVASSMFNDISSMSNTPVNIGNDTPVNTSPIQATAIPINNPQNSVNQIEEFDPSTWGGPSLTSDAVKYENIDKTIVVEWKKNENLARFKAIDNRTGEELVGCPVPTTDPRKLVFNEQDLTVKDNFDQIYKLEII